MRITALPALVALAGLTISPLCAEPDGFNHLDCRFDAIKGQMVCPNVLDGRIAPMVSTSEPAEASDNAVPKPEEITEETSPETSVIRRPPGAGADIASLEKGSEAWKAACAAKYRSFDAASGLYRSFSGQMRPCR